MSVIDLHCHVLPGVDRGPDDLQASVEMVRALRREGIDTAVAAPSLSEYGPELAAYELAGRTAELQHAADRAACGVRLVTGAEVTLGWALGASAVERRNASLAGAGTELLLSIPHGPLAPAFDDGVVELIDAGYRVVLAHPEVSASFQRSADRLLRLVAAGALVQVTARSLVRGGGSTPSAALARELVAGGTAHVLATDSYSAGPWRAPDLRRGVLEAARLAGAHAEWMVSEAPAAILAGEPLPRAPRRRPSQRGLARLQRELATA
jgi:protein-tyrosine phosphatase